MGLVPQSVQYENLSSQDIVCVFPANFADDIVNKIMLESPHALLMKTGSEKSFRAIRGDLLLSVNGKAVFVVSGTIRTLFVLLSKGKGGKMEIRRFRPEDAEKTAQVVAVTLKTSNSKDYSEAYIEANIASHSPEILIERAESGHMYVVCEDSRIIGCGAIAGYWGSTEESILLTIFVLPEYQGKGIGREIIRTLEQDEYFLRAKRIEIPASVTAVGFYRKMGYDFKNGIDTVDEEQVYRLEKFR